MANGPRSETQLSSEFAGKPTDTSVDGKVDVGAKTGTILSGYTVLTKSMIGSGMFAMAVGCASFGIILGIGFLTLAAAITWLSLRVLSMLALEYIETKPSFYSVSSDLMPKAKWVIDAALVINCFGGCIVYVQSFGKLMMEAFSSLFFESKDKMGWWTESSMSLVIQVVILALLTPLCMMKEISGTKIPNMIGLLCILYICVMTFFYTPCTQMSSALLKPGNVLRAFGSFPTFIFAYACQQNVFSISNELKDVSLKRLNVVSVASTVTGFIIYLPIMLLPFMTFGMDIESNYLYNLAKDHGKDVPVIVAFICASLSVSISYVLLMQPVRCSIMSLAFGERQPTGKKEKIIRISLVIGLVGLSFALAYVLGKSVSLPVNLAGLFGGNTMCFVMPFLLYFKKFGFDKKNKFSLAVLVTLGFCILLYPLCLTGIIYEAVN